jgi:hypothetical protein
MRAKFLLALGFVATLVLFLNFSFQENWPYPLKQNANDSPKPTRQQLRDSMFRSGGMHVVYPAKPEEFAARYRDYYTQQQRRGRWFRWRMWRDAEFPTDSLHLKPVSLIGAINSNQILPRLLPDLPIKRLQNGFHFHGQDYTDAGDIVYLSFPNPKNHTQLLNVLTGNSDEAILDFLQNSPRRFRQIGDYYIAQQGRVVLFGFFQDTGKAAWKLEAAKTYDLRVTPKPAQTTEHFTFVTRGKNPSLSEIEKLAARYEESLANLMKRLALANEKLVALPPLTVHLWDSAEEKGLLTGNTDLRHVDQARNETHLLWADDLRGDDFFAEAKWYLAKLLDEKTNPALEEGLAVAMAERWRGIGYAGWAARLAQTQNAPPLVELFDKEIRLLESELVRQPVLGSFANFLLEKFGPGDFTKLYRQWPDSGVADRFPQNETWEKLAAQWQEKIHAAPPVPLRYSSPRSIAANDFHRGFCYAHEGYQIYNGYLGSQSREALLKLAALSVNSISITPFGYMEEAGRPDFIRRSDGPYGESDESVVVAKNFAKDNHIRVMLKPHIWVGRGWPGDIHMPTPEAWKTFFDYYERWMRGHALLAEMHDFDMLCVGVELAQATIGHEQAWRQMIARLRGLYSGPMVYAANWGQEFENLKFWEALDAIGIDCYYPLSEKENPSDAELLSGAKRVVEKIRAVAEKFNKPVIVTEIGFTSSSQPWKNPHQEDRNAAVDLEAQRRCYEAVYQAFLNNKSSRWLAGIYWWKWPSTLEEGGPEDRQFMPNGKPAEKVAAKWYKQISRQLPITGQ